MEEKMKNLNGIKIVCGVCGSDNIMERSWFNPNTGENFGWDESDECYCNSCKCMRPWKEVNTTT